MQIPDRIKAFHDGMTDWRRDLHAHPELRFEEHRTSDVVAGKLAEFGCEVHRNIGKTGVVGVLRTGNGPPIGLRADMDALPIHEANDIPYRSRHDGRMHACGHDGHTTMLLGAARYLAETRNFDGTVHFVFQPAEEGIGGAKAMLDDGLFEHFPCESIFGMHNRPGLPIGNFAIRPGSMMAVGHSSTSLSRAKALMVPALRKASTLCSPPATSRPRSKRLSPAISVLWTLRC
jgi:hippurate hydrolase